MKKRLSCEKMKMKRWKDEKMKKQNNTTECRHSDYILYLPKTRVRVPPPNVRGGSESALYVTMPRHYWSCPAEGTSRMWHMWLNPHHHNPMRHWGNLEKKKHVFVLDPMLATGGSCSLTIRNLCKLGVEPKNITFINLVSCEKGITRLMADHPGIKVITACVDETLDEKSYILPGLGDYGDRYFGSRLPKWKTSI